MRQIDSAPLAIIESRLCRWRERASSSKNSSFAISKVTCRISRVAQREAPVEVEEKSFANNIRDIQSGVAHRVRFGRSPHSWKFRQETGRTYRCDSSFQHLSSTPLFHEKLGFPFRLAMERVLTLPISQPNYHHQEIPARCVAVPHPNLLP